MAVVNVKKDGEEKVVRRVVKEGAVQEKEVEKKISHDYSEISLSSCGKLSAPYKLHIRDYYTEDSMGIAKNKKDDKILESILEFLKDGIYEDVDPYMLHEKELEEIMLNIYTAFWDSKIHNYYYPAMLSEEELISELDEYNEIMKKKKGDDFEYQNFDDIPNQYLEVDIDLSKINSNPIQENFKEPIICTDGKGTEVTLRLPRIGDFFKVINFVEGALSNQDQKFKNVNNQSEESPLYKEYLAFLDEKEKMIAYGMHGSCLISVNGKVLESLEDQIEAVKKMNNGFWNFIWSKIEEVSGGFGIDDNVELISPLTGKKVNRRCRFQLLDLIPTSRIPTLAQYDCRFGD